MICIHQKHWIQVQQKVRDYLKILHIAAERGSGGQQPTEICTFPRGKRVYLFPKIHQAEKQQGHPKRKRKGKSSTATTKAKKPKTR